MTETVRIARADDFDVIWALLLMMHAESGVAPFDRDKSEETVRTCLDARAGGAALVACEHGRIVGTAGVIVAEPFWYSREQAFVGRWMFVHPDYRKSRHAVHLLDEMDRTAVQIGVKYFDGVTSFDRLEGKCRLYGRKFRKVGEFFVGGAG